MVFGVLLRQFCSDINIYLLLVLMLLYLRKFKDLIAVFLFFGRLTIQNTTSMNGRTALFSAMNSLIFQEGSIGHYGVRAFQKLNVSQVHDVTTALSLTLIPQKIFIVIVTKKMNICLV